MAYSRQSPSPRYLELISLYRRLHAEGESRLGISPEHMYPGVSLLPHVKRIKELIDQTGARTILDYGCGKATRYDIVDLDIPHVGRVESIIDYWDVDEVICYDPCVPKFERLISEPADGLISTDVLEHCPEDDVPWIVAEMFAHARKFVFANIACYPAKAHLPNGENAHCTIKPLEWWQTIFEKSSRNSPGLIWKLVLDLPAQSESN